jgi:hypothetical protein
MSEWPGTQSFLSSAYSLTQWASELFRGAKPWLADPTCGTFSIIPENHVYPGMGVGEQEETGMGIYRQGKGWLLRALPAAGSTPSLLGPVHTVCMWVTARGRMCVHTCMLSYAKGDGNSTVYALVPRGTCVCIPCALRHACWHVCKYAVASS